MLRTRSPLLFALLTGCAAAQLSSPAAPPPLPRTHIPVPTVGAITAADLTTRLYIFADDSMLGRETGTLGNVRGTDYVAREMARMGLTPGGEQGTFFQTVPVVLSRISSSSTFAIDGGPLTLWTDIAPQLGGVLTRPFDTSAPTIFGGQVGGTLLDSARATGKVVVLQPAQSVPPIAGVRMADAPFAGPPAAARAQQVALLPMAHVAAAMVFVIPDSSTSSAFERLRQPRQELLVTPGTSATTSAPVLFVTASAARRIFPAREVVSLQIGDAGRAVSGHLAITRDATPYPARNVIGILPGSDAQRRGQYVAIGAHNDHIGLTTRPLDHDSVLANNMVVRRQGVQDAVRTPTPPEAARIAILRDSLRIAHGGVARPDSVNNGADDDGSGTVAMLEIAERFATAAARPARSLLFVSHTGEEKGLWGSQWFTDHPTVTRDSIVAQLNMDMVGRGKPGDIMGRGPDNLQVIGPRRLSTQLGDVLDAVNAGRAQHMDIDASFDANGHPLNRYCRSDHYMYARYGIPISYFSLGYHDGYHQVTDEPQYIDYDHLARVAEFVHDVAEAVANRADRLVVDKPKPDPIGGCRQ